MARGSSSCSKEDYSLVDTLSCCRRGASPACGAVGVFTVVIVERQRIFQRAESRLSYRARSTTSPWESTQSEPRATCQRGQNHLGCPARPHGADPSQSSSGSQPETRWRAMWLMFVLLPPGVVASLPDGCDRHAFEDCIECVGRGELTAERWPSHETLTRLRAPSARTRAMLVAP